MSGNEHRLRPNEVWLQNRIPRILAFAIYKPQLFPLYPTNRNLVLTSSSPHSSSAAQGEPSGVGGFGHTHRLNSVMTRQMAWANLPRKTNDFLAKITYVETGGRAKKSATCVWKSWIWVAVFCVPRECLVKCTHSRLRISLSEDEYGV